MESKNIKNIGIIAHIDAGKTTLSERFLYYSGKIHKLGSVDEGTTELDYLEEEKERGITIISAATSFNWKGTTINLIDTPGHIDFIEEVRKALFVIDCCILVICGTSHVQAQTETLFNLCKKLNLPIIFFINKMDRNTSNFSKALESLEKNFNNNFLPINIPVYDIDDRFVGVLNLFTNKAYIYDINNDKNQEAFNIIDNFIDFNNELKINKNYKIKEDLNKLYKNIIDLLTNKSEFLLSIFLNSSHDSKNIFNTIKENYEKIINEIKNLSYERKIFIVFCGSAFKNIAIQPLLDGIIDFAPNYNFFKKKIYDIKNNQYIDIPENLAVGYIFKIIYDKQIGKIFFARIYKRKFEKNQKIYIPSKREFDKLQHIYHVHANKRVEIDSCEEGDIISIIGAKYLNLFDTFLSDKKDFVLNMVDIIDPVISLKIEPLSIKDYNNLLQILKIISSEDPSFKYKIDESSQDIIISGMGELHLEVIKNRIENEFKIKTRIGTQLINYKEAISKQNRILFNLKKDIKGITLKCEIDIECILDNNNNYEILDKSINEIYYPYIQNIINSVFNSGVKFGYPLYGIKIIIHKINLENKDGAEIILQETLNRALVKLIEEAQPIIYEPYMKIEVYTPMEYFSDVYNDLLKKGVSILNIDTIEEDSNLKIIKCEGYLRNFFGYSTTLRSLTSGKGTFSIEFKSYEKSIDKNY